MWEWPLVPCFPLQSPAYKASATDLLDKDQFSKGSGLVQLAESSKFLFSPIIAGILLSITTIEVILVINILTFLVAILAVLVIRKSMKVEQRGSRRQKLDHRYARGLEGSCNQQGSTVAGGDYFTCHLLSGIPGDTHWSDASVIHGCKDTWNVSVC
ncbi:hypothetical protein Q0F98_05270 [Paenibacillus amylolyticus]|nr:hypothetical protein Q0F98_05270 [Paenibacillus amylolyticus]